MRSYRGRAGAWYRAAQATRAGRIWISGEGKDVVFLEEADPATNDRIDTAYRSKYSRYPQYVDPMVTAEARATTLRLKPDPSKANV